MSLETANFIQGLNANNPGSQDFLSEGDNHLRLIKAVLKATFPEGSTALTIAMAELNALATGAQAAGRFEVAEDAESATASQLYTKEMLDEIFQPKVSFDANAQAVTGDIKFSVATALAGWIRWTEGTIGSAASLGSIRANDDAEDLFLLLWNNISDANAPVAGGRGVSAASDWEANKTIALPLGPGRALGISGNGTDLTNRSPGDTTGAEEHTLTNDEMPIHTHTATIPTKNEDGGGNPWGSGGAASEGDFDFETDPEGDDQPHNNMQPSLFMNAFMKL